MTAPSDGTDVDGAIADGVAKLKEAPGDWVCIIYQADMAEWPADQQKYKLVSRAGTRGFKPTGLSPDGGFMCILAEYQRLLPIAELGDAWARTSAFGLRALTFSLGSSFMLPSVST